MYMVRAGEISFLLIRYIVLFRDMKYPTEFHSYQIELYNFSLKMLSTLIETDYLAFDFPGYSTEVSSKIIVFCLNTQNDS